MLSFTCINQNYRKILIQLLFFLTKIYDQCLVYFANFVKDFIDWLQDFMSSNSVCLLSYSWWPDFVNRSHDYGRRWITLGPVTIIYV